MSRALMRLCKLLRRLNDGAMKLNASFDVKTHAVAASEVASGDCATCRENPRGGNDRYVEA